MKAVAPLLAGAASLALAAGGAWLDAPFVRQQRNGCGAASLAMVLQYWAGHYPSISPSEADAPAIFREVYSPDVEGTRPGALVHYLERRGFQAFAFRGEWRDLKHHLEKGRPPIVCLKNEGGSPLHYVVVAGVGEDMVLLNDPADRKLRRLDRASFERSWAGAGHWTLLAVPLLKP